MNLYSENAKGEDAFVDECVEDLKEYANGSEVPKWAEKMASYQIRIQYRLHQDAMQHGKFSYQLNLLWSKTPLKMKTAAAGLLASPYVALLTEKLL